MDLINNITAGCTIFYNSLPYRVIGKVKYYTLKNDKSWYYKIFLTEKRVIVASDDILTFGKEFGEISAKNAMGKVMSYQDKAYNLTTHDCQVVVSVEFGKPKNIEEEVEFWDYDSEDGSTTISIGIEKRNSQRSDVVSEYIKPDDIDIAS